jgi:hypothetical protein
LYILTFSFLDGKQSIVFCIVARILWIFSINFFVNYIVFVSVVVTFWRMY